MSKSYERCWCPTRYGPSKFVYVWGEKYRWLHHSPRYPDSFSEIRRLLKYGQKPKWTNGVNSWTYRGTWS